MYITPVIPDGYDGPIKQLTCRICKHLFYLTVILQHIVVLGPVWWRLVAV